MNNQITITAKINASIDKVWDFYNNPKHITEWNHASDDWYCPHAENDLRTGGSFTYRMEAKDGSMGFNFSGVYSEVELNHIIAYTLDDGRTVRVAFEATEDGVNITTAFDPETENSLEKQREGWQVILNNFKRYTEEN